jgi:hypothetical protein
MRITVVTAESRYGERVNHGGTVTISKSGSTSAPTRGLQRADDAGSVEKTKKAETTPPPAATPSSTTPAAERKPASNDEVTDARRMTSSGESLARAQLAAKGLPSDEQMKALKAHHPLARGDDSDEVKGDITELQTFLKEKGLLQGEPSGKFDDATDKAVREFQKQNGLKVDGVVGQQTWGAVLGVKVDPGLKLLAPWAHSFAHKTGAVTSSPDGSSLRQKALAMHGQPFLDKLDQVAGRLGVTPDSMLKIMNSESGLKTDAVNPNGGATGLIQFMPATARGLGTTTDALKKMSATEQLDYVERYYKPYAGRLKNATDLYTVTFYPAMLGQPGSYVAGGNNAGMIARANPAFDIDGDGVITAQNFRDWCKRRFGE